MILQAYLTDMASIVVQEVVNIAQQVHKYFSFCKIIIILFFRLLISNKYRVETSTIYEIYFNRVSNCSSFFHIIAIPYAII